MAGELTMELRMLSYTALLCAMLWIPYVLAVMKYRGLLKAAGYPTGMTNDLPEWGQRAHRAHLNFVENLAPFAVLVLIAHAIEVSTSMTVLATYLFFAARVVHAGCALAGIPIVRTIAFLVGIAADLILFAAIMYH